MPPRTNDNAPDREQAPQPPLPRPGRELGSRPTDTAGAPDILGTKDSDGTDGHADVALSGQGGTDVTGPVDSASAPSRNTSEPVSGILRHDPRRQLRQLRRTAFLGCRGHGGRPRGRCGLRARAGRLPRPVVPRLRPR